LLGRGGMGGVYLAERADGAFEQTVAIKFLRPGLDTRDFVGRLLAERRILSSLEHPNIARLLDGGSTDRGLPYLVLEYVDGIPITEYCRRHGCTIDQRLELFIQVARAVQYAHSNLVVHRDIKPSNILVTDEGRVKLLDFGIAKLLGPDGGRPEGPLTRTGLRPLTPDYASPEQIKGEPVTTASDVYQLGVLLYRLLTGAPPYRVAATGGTLESAISTVRPRPPSDAVVATAKEAGHSGSSPRSPSRLRKRLRGDLDTIVLKALRKEPARRYATALEMADDVRRHLDGRPITARRESRLYRTGKFLRRNAWVAPVTAAGILLMAGFVLTLIRHGNELEAERDVARDVQSAFVSFFTAPDSGEVGLGEGRRDQTILEAIQDGAERVRVDLRDRPAARAELFTAMASVLQDLDEPADALELAEEALELERTLYGGKSAQVHETLLLVGELHPEADSARALLEQRLELSRHLYGAESVETAASIHALAELDLREGQLEGAVLGFREAIDLYRSAGSVHTRRIALAFAEMTDALEALGRHEESVAVAREGYGLLVDEFGEGHSQTAVGRGRLAQALTGAGRYDEARPLYEASLVTLDAELGSTHATTMRFRNNYALLLDVMEDLETSEAVYQELLVALEDRYGTVHYEVAASLQNLAAVVKDRGRYGDAEALSRRAHEIFEATVGPAHFQTAYPLITISELRLLVEDYPGAEAVARNALDILRAALPGGHFATAVAECRMARALAGQGRVAEARPLLEGALAAIEDLGPFVESYRAECAQALRGL
ncbi:MAG: serine/threonine protein kinase, partial [Gemmatimonadetes bacterium]|nr:serine/threonine protein kinase [Gemmatimonadota bacterium]